jgi:hypothetical protein
MNSCRLYGQNDFDTLTASAIARIDFPWVFNKAGPSTITDALNSCIAVPSAGIHAVNAIVTEGLNRDRIEPPQPWGGAKKAYWIPYWNASGIGR